MAIFTLTDAVIWADSVDLTGVSNKVTLKTNTNEKDSTVFGGGGYKARLGGLEDVEIDASGFMEVAAAAASQDAVAFAMLGAANKAFTIAPTSTAGSTAYLAQAVPLSYSALGANVGDIAPYDLAAKGSAPLALARGMLVPKTTVSATGALGTPMNLGALGGTKRIYAALHIFTIGTSVTVQVQSAPLSNFASPTTQLSFGLQSAVGGLFLTSGLTAGTDPWWRLNVFANVGTSVVSGAVAIQ